jgi:hypothetical protein
MQGNQNNPGSGGPGGQGGGGRHHRRRHRGGRRDQGPQTGGPPQAGRSQAENRNRQFQSGQRHRRSGGRPLTSNQVLVKYDNLLEQHLITRRKYYEYFNRADERQLKKLEKNFFDSIEHLRRFEANLEPWQREVLEKRKTERYKLDLTYSLNRGLDPAAQPQVELAPEEIGDPHFTETQKEAFDEYREDREESEGTYEDYLKLKGLN